MTSISRCATIALASLAITAAVAQAADSNAAPAHDHAVASEPSTPAPAKLTLFTFGPDFNLSQIHANGATAVRSSTPNALTVSAPAHAAWPGVVIDAPAGKWDLSAYQYVSIDLHNTDTKDIEIFVNLNNPGFNGLQHCIGNVTTVAPDQRTTLTIPIKRVAGDNKIDLWGMSGYPQGLYPGNRALDPADVISITVFTRNNPTATHVDISNVLAAGHYVSPPWLHMTPAQFFPFVDSFGQFIHADWPGKTHSVAELQADAKAQATQRAADPGPAHWDPYGGDAASPVRNPTGHFHTAKIDGKWWLIDPDGHLFFSTGLCGVGPDSAAGVIEDRASWFKNLPPDSGDTAQFYGHTYRQWVGRFKGKTPAIFNFSAYDLFQKLGPDWKQQFLTMTPHRLRTWGINTYGNWSDEALIKAHNFPYTMTFYYSSPRLSTTNAGFPDPFDPQFKPALLRGARQFLAGTFDDPYCVGYYCDNEMPWGGNSTLARTALKLPKTSAAKQQLVEFLRGTYPLIGDFNTAWGVKVDSFDALLDNTKLDPQTVDAERDLAAFTVKIAEAYFKTVHDVLREVAPHQLYLGCRSVGGSDGVAAMACKYCDVVSYNRYTHSIRDLRLPAHLDAPMIIGEFHFGALDRGLFSAGLVSAPNQAGRATDYTNYLHSALENPQMVGVTWFQYGDSPLIGRGDGENENCGFVDVGDNPYPELTAAARNIGETMYDYRPSAKP